MEGIPVNAKVAELPNVASPELLQSKISGSSATPSSSTVPRMCMINHVAPPALTLSNQIIALLLGFLMGCHNWQVRGCGWISVKVALVGAAGHVGWDCHLKQLLGWGEMWWNADFVW